MKERLLIISDLWGVKKSQWLIHYTQILETKFEPIWYDSCSLGNLDTSTYTQENLHTQFVDGGIEIAVEELIKNEKNPVHILAFSIGGVIAWNFGLRTNTIKSLTCISSTRLRKETKKPKGKITLYFGEKDKHAPPTAWLENMQLASKIVPNKTHEMYQETEFAIHLSKKIVTDIVK